MTNMYTPTHTHTPLSSSHAELLSAQSIKQVFDIHGLSSRGIAATGREEETDSGKEESETDGRIKTRGRIYFHLKDGW